MRDFVHLHLHSEYSLLDGACRISEIPRRAKELGMSACAITDHGSLCGAINFYHACKKEGIKPIVGIEVYVAPKDRRDKEGRADLSGNHLILLAENEEGYRNLCRIASDAYSVGFYGKPRTDTQTLRTHSSGIIALSACLAGYIPRQIAAGNFAEADRYALELSEIFGRDHFYLELQDHRLEEQARVNAALVDMSRRLGLPLVATNDVHYLTKKDAYTQRILTCIQTGTTVSDGSPLGFETDEFYFKSGEEMQHLFAAYPEALDNTVRIAERCNVEFTFGKLKLPTFDCGSETPAALLRRYAEEGMTAKTKAGRIDFAKFAENKYRERIDHELSIIETMGFCEYFLIVRDFVTWAKRTGIPVGPGRGSGAGSLVSFLIGITDVDPLPYGLLFERFLNPERVTMPDFDIDLCQNRREEVIRYVTEKYGEDHVSQIVAFDTLAARGAVRDVGRALGLPYADVDRVAKAIPREYNTTLSEALEAKDFNDLYTSSPQIKQLIDIAMSLEGMPRHASTHAAGVVITDRVLTDYLPTQKNGDTTVTQYEKDTVEELGLVKIDFLGLRFVTIMDAAEKLIRAENPGFSLDEIPLDDKKTLAMIAEGKTAGIFQLESAGMRKVLSQLQPEGIDDVIAAIALYRPGPMEVIPRYINNRHHPEAVRYIVPELEKILDVTHGCIVYQEQVMQIFRALAGYTYGQADIVRRAMAKKKTDVMVAEGEKFVARAGAAGIPAEKAKQIYQEMANFAKYAFNKSHAAAYGIIAYRTAYLKAHETRFYMAALLTSVLGMFSATAFYIAECARFGIRVLSADINESGIGFTVSGQNIRFGLLAVKCCGAQFAADIIAERANKRFSSFEDFITRMAARGLNKKQLEMLIKCGAFDSLGVFRSRLMATFEHQLDLAADKARSTVTGQMDLFSACEELSDSSFEYPQIPEFSMRERLAMEKESVGVYFSGHMLDEYSDACAAVNAISIGELLNRDEMTDPSAPVTVCGIVTRITEKLTKKGDAMAFCTVEDRFGEIEVILFPKVFTLAHGYLAVDRAVMLTGTVDGGDDETPKMLANSIAPLSVNGSAPRGVTIGTVAPVTPVTPAPQAPVGGSAFSRMRKMADARIEPVTRPAAESASAPAPKKAVPKAEPEAPATRLCLRVPSLDAIETKKAVNLVEIFCGSLPVLLYDSSQKKYITLENYGADPCAALLRELTALLGRENVVLQRQSQ